METAKLLRLIANSRLEREKRRKFVEISSLIDEGRADYVRLDDNIYL